MGYKTWLTLALVLSMLAGLNAVVYINAAETPGFPLDDAWIHQVYARSLGLNGRMEFNPGVQSSGSTSPGWTALLALGYTLQISPVLWAYTWGSIFAVLTAMAATYLSWCWFNRPWGACLVGILALLEWRLAWAALSGMETLLFALISLVFLIRVNDDSHPALLGLISGLAVLIRPEGFILAASYLMVEVWRWRKTRWKAIKSVVIFTSILALMVLPLLSFNMATGGRPFPNTVYAKNLQYGYPWSLLKTIRFYYDVWMYYWIGPLFLLAPFTIMQVYRLIKSGDRRFAVPLLWMGGLVVLYSIALPAIFDLGRYLMPLTPLIIIFGVEGLYFVVDRLPRFQRFWWVYKIALIVMVAVLWFNGRRAFSLRVDLLESNHHRIAVWLNQHTSSGAIIATHDVGLLGYYSQRRLVDLAGLVTPQVIPILNDQSALARFCREEGVDYLVVYTGYYTRLLRELDANLVFSPDSERMRSLGAEPFEVFATKPVK